MLSFFQLSDNPWTIAHQAALSMEFSRQEYWSERPFPSPGNLSSLGSNLGLLQCRQILYHLRPPGIIPETLPQYLSFIPPKWSRGPGLVPAPPSTLLPRPQRRAVRKRHQGTCSLRLGLLDITSLSLACPWPLSICENFSCFLPPAFTAAPSSTTPNPRALPK